MLGGASGRDRRLTLRRVRQRWSRAGRASRSFPYPRRAVWRRSWDPNAHLHRDGHAPRPVRRARTDYGLGYRLGAGWGLGARGAAVGFGVLWCAAVLPRAVVTPDRKIEAIFGWPLGRLASAGAWSLWAPLAWMPLAERSSRGVRALTLKRRKQKSRRWLVSDGCSAPPLPLFRTHRWVDAASPRMALSRPVMTMLMPLGRSSARATSPTRSGPAAPLQRGGPPLRRRRSAPPAALRSRVRSALIRRADERAQQN